jgi:hypothetical protein
VTRHVPPFILKYKQPQYATVLNGTSQYWSCTPSYIVKNTLITPTTLNGGFETLGAGGADVFANWTESASTGRIADTTDAISGTHALVMQQGGAGTDVFLSQVSLIVPGKVYRVSFWAKSNSSHTLRIGNGLTGTQSYIPTLTTSWQYYSGVFYPTSNTATNFVVERNSNSANAMYIIDDITCEEVEGSLDLNGGELINIGNSNNGNFETTIGNWLGSGNHSVTRSTTDDRTGSASMQIVSTGAGDTTTNHAKLASGNFTALTVSNKYTVEGWARGTGVLGSELTTNGDFASDTWWSHPDPTVTISGGLAHFTSTPNGQTLGRTGFSTSGRTYEITYTILNRASGSIRIEFSSSFGATRSANGTYTERIVADGTAIYFVTKTTGTTLDIDNVSIKEVTLPSITANIGSKSATTSSVSCVSGTFTKFVLNFQATASEIGQPLKLYVNQADTVFVDDVSLKQAYDAIVLSATKTPDATQNSISVYITNGSAFYDNLQVVSTGRFRPRISDGTTQITATNSTTANLGDGKYHFLGLVFDRSGNMTRYVDGSSVGYTADAITTVGSFSGVTELRIGASTSIYFNGQVSSVQIIRFSALPSDGGASIIADAYNRFRSGKGFQRAYSGGTVVAWYDWRSQGTDLSGQGNHLTPTASPPIVKIP